MKFGGFYTCKKYTFLTVKALVVCFQHAKNIPKLDVRSWATLVKILVVAGAASKGGTK